MIHILLFVLAICEPFITRSDNILQVNRRAGLYVTKAIKNRFPLSRSTLKLILSSSASFSGLRFANTMMVPTNPETAYPAISPEMLPNTPNNPHTQLPNVL